MLVIGPPATGCDPRNSAPWDGAICSNCNKSRLRNTLRRKAVEVFAENENRCGAGVFRGAIQAPTRPCFRPINRVFGRLRWLIVTGPSVPVLFFWQASENRPGVASE